MSISSGTKLGPYEIIAPVAAGGMGEVYKARDMRLNRTVAIKVLPAQLCSDPPRRQRFEREAKTISGLNHPHICVLHDVGHQGGVDYLVMEWLEGETLARRLEKGPLPLEQVLTYGTQIASALEKAHRSGIVHRDIKPSNIMLTQSGAKVLDFGLAKLAAPLASSVAPTADMPTSPVTEEGTIVGTLQYMSPEQVGGQQVDGRSDLFSLGAVLYEMVTGNRAFEAKTRLSLASAILEKEPASISTVKPMTPRALDHALKKCLAKVADERWQSASDLASELKWIGEGGAQADNTVLAHTTNASKERIAWLIAAASVVALILVLIWWRNSKPPREVMYFSARLSFPANDIAVASNGHTIAAVGYLESARKNALWIYEVGSRDASSLAETGGASYPFWSADGRTLAFFADGKLKKVDVSGGPVQTICDAPSGRGGTWNKDGVIVFTPDGRQGGGLYRVLASGETPKPIAIPDRARGEDSYRWPMFLPDGTHYLYMAANFSGRNDEDAILVGSLDSNEKRFIVKASANAAYAAPGYLVFYRDKTLLAQRFALKQFALTGEPAAMLADVQYRSNVKRAVFAVSSNGLLLAQGDSGAAISRPMWFDRNGGVLGAVGEPGVYGNVSLAPSGKLAAVSITDIASQNTDVWIYDLLRASAKRLTFDPAIDRVPIWSPDAKRLVFTSNRQLNIDLYMKNADGTQEEKSVVSDDFNKYPNDWSRDGRYILYTRGPDLLFVTVPELRSSLYLKAVSVLRNGQFSPDGKWVAYASNESGKWEIYVTSFPEPLGKWQVSTGGGEQPRWRSDGKELFYLSSDNKMMAAPVTTGTKFDSGTPVALFQANPREQVSLNDVFVYDVRPDGQAFLINTKVRQAETAPMSVVLNWDAKAKN
ncbi:MAG TPA: protein kinase [Candidatus Sulfotelmatobacter sp.]|nr:protein kinase [Candidatus Sulfotelmatobacter sp.]